jgi:endonuclease G
MFGFTKDFLAAFLVLVAASSLLEAQERNRNVQFGLPAPARHDPREHEHFLIERPQYVLSYNDKTRTPNWVCWQLRRSDLGHGQRAPFEPDPHLPPSFTTVISQVYSGSGFDRGHQCPAQDRSARQVDMDATFFMSNVVPQSPASNQQGWERLESYCRALARDGHVLYICCGPHGVGGEGLNGRRETIGRIRVTVPAQLWKVILVLPREDAEPRKNSRAIAVVMPNDQSVGFDWTKYRVSVREVERLTGYNFFPRIPMDVAREIKAQPDDVTVHVPRPNRSAK